MKSIGIVIVTWNSEAHIDECLRAAIDRAEEVIVVDNASSDRTPELVRNYPGEQPLITIADGNGWVSWRSYRIVYGLEFSGGNANEGGGLVLGGRSVAKRVLVHDFDNERLYNPTGVKVTGDGLLDQVVAWDNYDRGNLTHHNSSNFLFYGTSTTETGHAYFIDSLSLSYSASGFKIKHAGDETRLHIHKSAALGGLRPWAGVQNQATVRHSWFFTGTDNDNSTFNISVTDPTTGGETHTDEGMLIEHNHIINATADGKAISQGSWALGTEPDTPALWKDNVIETTGTGNGNVYIAGRYVSNTLPATWTIKFDSNSVFTTSDSNAMIMSGVAYPLATLFAYGVENNTLSTAGDYEFSVAGRSFRIQNGVLTEQ